MNNTEHEQTSWDALVKIPADVEKPDTLLGQLTARQTAWLAGTVAVLWLSWHALRPLVPPLVYLTGAALVLVVVAAVVLTRRDGVPLERWLADALHHRQAPKRLLPTPAGDPAPVLLAGVGGLELPVTGIEEDGTLLLSDGGCATVCEATTVNLSLRTAAEQRALVAGFGGWLNALTGPVQILVRSHRLDLAPLIAQLERHAGGLPHPLLEDAAWAHAEYLAQLAGQQELRSRQILVVHREPASDQPSRLRVQRRAAETTGLLAVADVGTRRLDRERVWQVLADACDPNQPPAASLALPGHPVTAVGSGGEVR